MKRILWCAACALFVLSSATLLPACGDEETKTSGLKCGTGTAAKDGACVPEMQALKCGAGTEEKAGACVPTTPGGQVVCGSGTTLDEAMTTCVLDTSPGGRTLPKIASVTLKELTVVGEDVPLMVRHPFQASVAVEVAGAEPFDSIAVIRLVSADGSKACNTGYFSLSYEGDNGEMAEGQNPNLLVGEETFYVQDACSVLAGETGVKVDIAFDPFGRTEWAQRVLPDFTEDGRDDVEGQKELFALATLGQAECKPAQGSSHPETCATALELKANAGKDVVLDGLDLGSQIALLPYFAQNNDPSSKTKGSFVDPITGETVNLAGEDELTSRGNLTQDPQFAVNASVFVYGQGSDDAEKTEDIELSFDLRPIFPDQAQSERTIEFDWAPLTAQYYEVKKAGEDPTLVELEKDFLDSIVGPVEVQKDSPIYISDFTDDAGVVHDVRTRVLDGMWSSFERFELRVCAALPGGATEGSRLDDASSNNCQTREVVVIRDAQTTSQSYNEVKAMAAGRIEWATPWEETWGSSLRLRLYAGPEVNVIKQRVLVGAKVGADLSGYFDFTLFEARANGQDWFTQDNDKVQAYVTLFGIRLISYSKDLPDGTYSLKGSDGGRDNPLEISKNFRKSKTICKFVCIYVEGNLTLAAGLDIILTKSASNAEYTSATAADGTTRYKHYNERVTFDEAQRRCRDKAGTLAEPRDEASFDAIAQAFGSRYWSWVNASSEIGSCKVADADAISARQDLARRLNVSPSDDDAIDSAVRRCRNTSFFDFSCLPLRDAVRDFVSAQSRANACTLAAFQAPSNWRLRGNTGGQLVPGKWGVGQPNDFANGQTHVRINSFNGDIFLGDMPPNARGAYICEFNPGSELTLTLEPFAKADISLYGGLSLVALRAGAYVRANILKLSMPLRGGLNYQLDTPNRNIYVTPILDLRLKLSTLKGDVGLWQENWETGFFYARWSERREWPIYKWDGIELTNLLLWELNVPPASISF